MVPRYFDFEQVMAILLGFTVYVPKEVRRMMIV